MQAFFFYTVYRSRRNIQPTLLVFMFLILSFGFEFYTLTF